MECNERLAGITIETPSVEGEVATTFEE